MNAPAANGREPQLVLLPDLGDFHDMPVIELSVKPGDTVTVEQTLLVVESDKATMDIPAPYAGRVVELRVALGDKISPGAPIALMEPQGAAAEAEFASDKARGLASSEPAVLSAQVVLPVPEEPVAQEPALPADAHVDLLVIGAGPGGYTAAFRAADLGRKVTLVDRWDKLGGVCLNVGCIPSKALLHAAKVIKDAEGFAAHGVRFGKPEVDLERLRGWKDSVVTKLTGGLNDLARRRDVTVLHGTARLTGPHTVVIEGPGGPRTLRFDQCILAAGSEPMRLPFVPHDDPRVVDSTGALALADVPARLLVIGGGIIGLEMATVYEALGSRVTVVELMDQIIPGADRDLVAPLAKHMAAQGVSFRLGVKVTAVEAGPEGLLARFEASGSKDEGLFDRVLVAVGRRANGGQMGAEAAGLTLAPDGTIAVDAQMRTGVAHIFVIGDLAGQPMLAHKATHEAKIAAEAACGHKVAFDARAIPAVAYTDPEVAWVGLTEAEAQRQGIAVEKAVFPWAASGRALALAREEGFTKLLFDRDTRRLVGAGIVGVGAGELISEAALAIEMGADASDIGLTLPPHPPPPWHPAPPAPPPPRRRW